MTLGFDVCRCHGSDPDMGPCQKSSQCLRHLSLHDLAVSEWTPQSQRLCRDDEYSSFIPVKQQEDAWS